MNHRSNRLGGMAPILFALFFAVINFSLVEDNVRYALAGSLSIVMGLFYFIMVVRKWNKAGYENVKYFVVISSLIIAVSYWFPPETDYGESKFYYFFFVFSLGLIIVPRLFSTSDNLEDFAFWLLIVATGYCMISLFAPGTGVNVRRSGIGLNPSIMGKVCIIPAIYGASYFLQQVDRQRYKDVLFVVVIVVSLLAVLRTGSRGPILIYIFGFLLAAIFTNAGKNIVRGLALVFLAVVSLYVASYYQLVPAEIVSRFTLESIAPSEHRDEGDRLDIFSLAASLIPEHPFGIGFGNFSTYHRFIVAPHNFILEATLELGWLVGAVFIFLFVTVFSRLRKIAAVGSIGVTFLCMLFLNQFFGLMIGGEMTHQSLLLYVCVGLILRYSFIVVGPEASLRRRSGYKRLFR